MAFAAIVQRFGFVLIILASEAEAAMAEGSAVQAGGLYTLTGITDGSWVCWKTHASAAPAAMTAGECGDVGTVSNIGVATTVVCSSAVSGATTKALTYDDPATTKVAFAECSGNGAIVDAGLAVTLAQAPATIQSLTTETIEAGTQTTLQFVTTGLSANTLGYRFFKLTPAAVACDAAAGVGDAIGGGSAQVVFSSLTAGTYAATITDTQTIATAGPYKVCQSLAADGTYAALTAAADTIAITVKTVVVASVTPNTQVISSPTTYTFTTSGGVLQTGDSNQVYIKVTVAGASNTADGVVGWKDTTTATKGVACVWASATTCTVSSTATSTGASLLFWYATQANKDNAGSYARIGSEVNAVTEAVAVTTCDATAAITNGAQGDCTTTLASGSTCQPECTATYTVSGTSSCTGTALTAATCTATEGKCTGNTVQTGDVDCSAEATNKQNKGSTFTGANAATCCEAVSADCNAAAAPANGAVGTCTATLAKGSTCAPTCNDKYLVSAASSCSSTGVYVAATCTAIANKCTGNLVAAQDVSCAAEATKKQNKGSTFAGANAATCCEVPTTTTAVPATASSSIKASQAGETLIFGVVMLALVAFI